jgi:hypothetical protein
MLVCSRTLLLVCAAVFPVLLAAQDQPPVSAGGRWIFSSQINPPDGRKVLVFSLPAEQAELGRSPEIQLSCADRKLVHARYFADTTLLAKDGDYANYQTPAIIPKIEIDKKKLKGLWDLLPDNKSMEMDKKSLRAMFQGSEMQVRYRDKAYDNLVDVFAVSGINKAAVLKYCGPQGWF